MLRPGRISATTVTGAAQSPMPVPMITRAGRKPRA